MKIILFIIATVIFSIKSILFAFSIPTNITIFTKIENVSNNKTNQYNWYFGKINLDEFVLNYFKKNLFTNIQENSPVFIVNINNNIKIQSNIMENNNFFILPIFCLGVPVGDVGIDINLSVDIRYSGALIKKFRISKSIKKFVWIYNRRKNLGIVLIGEVLDDMVNQIKNEKEKIYLTTFLKIKK